ncbi:MAG: VIT1/CCC1 transporter family protein [Candidatus Micrarchaeota archaeon]
MKTSVHLGPQTGKGALIRDVILGGQDGLVNVLGIVLGVAVATQDVSVTIIAGLASAFTESFSMAAVAYTSTKAEEDFYYSELERERYEIKHFPEIERKEIRAIYSNKGFKGRLLDEIVRHITRSERIWLNVMMREEVGLSIEHKNAFKSALIVLFAALIGSLSTIIPFFAALFFGISIGAAMIVSLVLSAVILFAVGFFKARITIGVDWKSGLELMIIGLLSAGVGYVVGAVTGGLLI